MEAFATNIKCLNKTRPDSGLLCFPIFMKTFVFYSQIFFATLVRQPDQVQNSDFVLANIFATLVLVPTPTRLSSHLWAY